MKKYVLKFKSDSYLKPLPFNLNKLDSNTLKSYKAGDEIDVSEYTPKLQGNHVRVILESFDPNTDCIEDVEKFFYCSEEDIEILLSEVAFDGEDPQQFPPPRASKVDLDVDYHSQLNNKNNPYGSCNVTSMSMLLKFYGVDSRTQADRDRNVQLEDVLYERTLDWDAQYGMTTRHVPDYLMKLLREFGDKYGNGALQESYFNPTASEEDIKQHIANGNPVVVHGYFTNFGHIIVVNGNSSCRWGGSADVGS
ncbi:MAG: C39 family peptidase [Microcoleaceae cyanobacterium]